jgi:hypothetical protein
MSDIHSIQMLTTCSGTDPYAGMATDVESITENGTSEAEMPEAFAEDDGLGDN